jgi:hypothetical protein
MGSQVWRDVLKCTWVPARSKIHAARYRGSVDRREFLCVPSFLVAAHIANSRGPSKSDDLQAICAPPTQETSGIDPRATYTTETSESVRMSPREAEVDRRRLWVDSSRSRACSADWRGQFKAFDL